MSLSLLCSCGSRFEVEDSFAGQEVTCPQCQSPVKVPVPPRGVVHTCDFAIGSLVLALVGAFTIVGTLAAMVLGIVAIVRIQRNGSRLAGMGYAISGIALGLLFTVLCVFAIARAELFGIGGQLRRQLLASKVDDPPDLVVAYKGADGFTIRRASHEWAVGRNELLEDSEFMLVNMKRDAEINVQVVPQAQVDLQSYAQLYLDNLHELEKDGARTKLHKISKVKLMSKSILPSKAGMERMELKLEMRLLSLPYALLVYIIRSANSDFFVVTAQAQIRIFPQLEAEMRQMLESFEPAR